MSKTTEKNVKDYCKHLSTALIHNYASKNGPQSTQRLTSRDLQSSYQVKVSNLMINSPRKLAWMLIVLILSVYGNHAVLAQKKRSSSGVNKQCGQDLFEPNDLRSRARNLSKELRNNREITAKICRDDNDWYTVWLNRGDLVEFTISSAIDKSPRLSIYAPRKRKASGVMHRVSPSVRTLKVYAKKSGRYRLHVESSREARSAYTLSYNKPLY